MIKHSGCVYQCMDSAPFQWDLANVENVLLQSDKEITVLIWDQWSSWKEKKTERAFNVFKFHSVRILQQWWINCFHECFFCELPSKVVSFKRLILFEGLPQPPHIPRDGSYHLCACVGGIYANGSYSKVEGKMEVRRKLLWNWMSRGFFLSTSSCSVAACWMGSEGGLIMTRNRCDRLQAGNISASLIPISVA